MFIGRVDIIGIKAKAHRTESRPSSFLNRATMGMLPPLRVGMGFLRNDSCMALLAATYPGEVVSSNTGSPPCPRGNFNLYGWGGYFFKMFFKQVQYLVRVLVGYKAHRNFGKCFRSDNRFRALTLVSAPNAIQFYGRSGRGPLQVVYPFSPIMSFIPRSFL